VEIVTKSLIGRGRSRGQTVASGCITKKLKRRGKKRESGRAQIALSYGLLRGRRWVCVKKTGIIPRSEVVSLKITKTSGRVWGGVSGGGTAKGIEGESLGEKTFSKKDGPRKGLA